MKTKTIAADFSKGQPVFDVIEHELKDIPVGILGKVCVSSFVCCVGSVRLTQDVSQEVAIGAIVPGPPQNKGLQTL